MTTRITGFKVYTSDDRGCPDYFLGNEMHLQDLNEGHGGKYIYIGRKRERITSKNHRDAVTSLDFLAFSNKQTQKPAGWEFWDDHDLNEGAGGKYIYMVWNKGESWQKPIVEIDFCVGKDQGNCEKKGVSWVRINQDLCEGSGGSYIWCYCFRG